MSTQALLLRPGTFPALRAPLIGREREVAGLTGLLRRDDVPLVTLTGPGGVGKTRIAVAVAAQIGSEFPDGARFADLSPIREPQRVLPTIARSLGLTDKGTQPVAEQLVGHLANRTMLIVVDNVEQVVSAAPDIAGLLASCPGVAILATSRVPLRLSAEHEYLVEPLPVSDAVSLFEERARRSVPTFGISHDNRAIVEAICERLDGLPLAIELAAARVSVLPPRALLARLEYALPLLTGGARDQPDRLRTMRDAIAWSHTLLSADERVLFRRLAVFVGGFGLDAAEQLAAHLDVGDHAHQSGYIPEHASALDGVASLVEKSLLRQDLDVASEDPRYRMLETVREFGLERLEASGEFEEVRRAHASYYARLADQAEPELTEAGQLDWFGRFETEHANLRAALSWLIEHDPEMGLRMAGSLIRFWDHHSHVREGLGWLEAAIERSDDLPAALRAKALWGAGALARNAGDYARAEHHLIRSVELARVARDRYLSGFALGALGTVAVDCGDVNRGAALVEEGLDDVREVGDDDAIAALLGNLSSIAIFQGDHERAVTLAEESLELYRGLGSVHGVASVLGHLGRARLELGDREQAMETLAEGLVQGQLSGNKWYVVQALEGMAAVATASRQWERAARLFGAVEALAEASGFAVHPADRTLNERYLARVRDQLDESTFASAWEAGTQLSLDGAVAEAIEILSPPDRGVSPSSPSDPAQAAGLTAREVEVLTLLAQGMSDREIANALYLSPRTVGGHVSSILAKLDVETRTAAAVLAVRRGLI